MKGSWFIRTKLVPILIGFFITGLFIWQAFWPGTVLSPIFERLDNAAYDIRLRATMPHTAKDFPVVIVDIDELSLRERGRWPWPRALLAQLTTDLHNLGVQVVAFDLVFSEPEQNPIDRVEVLLHDRAVDPTLVNTVLGLRESLDADAIFANSLKAQDSILGYFFEYTEVRPSGMLPTPIQQLDSAQAPHTSLLSAQSYAANIPTLAAAAKDQGFVSTDKDIDGSIRRAPLVFRYQNGVYGSLGLAAARAYLLVDTVKLQFSEGETAGALEGLWLDKQWIPTDSEGRVFIPFLGPGYSFDYISADKIMSGTVDRKRIENKIVLVGSSALGLADLSATAAENIFPGVEVHANIIAGILGNHFPAEPIWADGFNLVLLLILGVGLSIGLSFVGPLSILLIGFGLIGIHLFFNIWAWMAHGYVLTLMLPFILITLLMGLYALYGFLFEGRQKRQITGMFGQYVSPHIVKAMSEDPEQYNFEGHSRELTVLFSDIVHFTNISETLSATQVKELLNTYFEPMTELILTNNGTIDKYVGDMIMAFWGAPLPDENQADDAIATAIAMIASTKRLSLDFKERGLPSVSIGIGVNTGNMHVGDMGSRYRRSYTVLGDSVNLGSRLEALTRYYGVDIIIGETTYDLQRRYCCRILDRVKVKGKKKAVKIYEPLCLLTEMDAELESALTRYNEIQELYLVKQFERALEKLKHLLGEYPADPIYNLYRKRIIDLIADPPGEDFDGVIVRDTK